VTSLDADHRPNVDDPERFLKILEDPWYRLLVRLQDKLCFATHRFWHERGGLHMLLPITTGSVSSPMGLGSDSSPVEIDLFGERTYLADSMQFMLEYGIRFEGRTTYYVMPSFRGEEPDETHLSQFFHSEAEIVGGLDDVIEASEQYLRRLVAEALTETATLMEIGIGTDHLESLLTKDRLPRIMFDEAASFLASNSAYVLEHGGGRWRTITRAGERQLIREFGGAVWLTHFDHLSVPFYQAFADVTQRTALNADLLLGLGEVLGCGERHATDEQVRRALEMHGISRSSYQWYSDLKGRYPMRTAGFGLGLERLLAWILRHNDIRDLQLLPRHNGRALLP
jgi:asparaginyl-tRNA synthetase